MDILKVYHSCHERRNAFRMFSADKKFHHTCTALTETGDRYVFAWVETLVHTERFAGLRFDCISISDPKRITQQAQEALLTLQRPA